MTKKTIKTKKMKKASPQLQSTNGLRIKLHKEHMEIGDYLLFRYDVRHFLATTGNTNLDTFVESNASKCARTGIKNPNGSVEVGCQTINPKTVKAIRTWANA